MLVLLGGVDGAVAVAVAVADAVAVAVAVAAAVLLLFRYLSNGGGSLSLYDKCSMIPSPSAEFLGTQVNSKKMQF